MEDNVVIVRTGEDYIFRIGSFTKWFMTWEVYVQLSWMNIKLIDRAKIIA